MKQKLTKMIGLGLAVMAITPLATASSAMAWGPADRPTYTMAHPADHAVFNSMTDNAFAGDERDFVKIVEKGTGNDYTNSLEIEGGKDYDVYIYFHNNASATYNYKEYNYAGAAMDVKMASTFPTELKAGEKGTIGGTISWTTYADRDTVQKVWDEAYVTAKEDLTLHYVAASAIFYNGRAANGTGLSTSLFSSEGTYLGVDKLNGIVMGCDEYSGHVIYTIRTAATGTPAAPVEPTPETPVELPNTGPGEVFLAAALVIVVVAGVTYWGKMHNEVKKVTKRAKGKK